MGVVGVRSLGTLLRRGAHVLHPISYLPLSITLILKPWTFNQRTSNTPLNYKKYRRMSVENKAGWIIIGVSGVTCGGKTTLANKLQDLLVPVYVFHQDKYFYPDDSPHHIKCKGLDHNNYDILSSLNMPLMYEDIVRTINGENKAHKHNLERSYGKLEAQGKKFMVVEGFTVLNYKPIMEICDFR